MLDFKNNNKKGSGQSPAESGQGTSSLDIKEMEREANL